MRLGLLLLCLAASADAIYTADAITAFRVPDGKIVVDGKPELLWRALSAQNGAVSTLSFQDYAKLVLLQPENVRNADPSRYVKNPVNGTVSMLAAYDNAALYFLFLVKTKTVVNAKTVCLTADNLWKADAPDVFLDPSVWVDDSTSYRSYFSADAGGLIFGTSPKTIELAKPLYDKDTRFFFRNRASADKFQVVAPPSGVQAASSRLTASDTSAMVVEMKIPYWGGFSSAYSGKKSAFISWGFNMYPDSLWGNCNGNPLAYRWAKHYVNYDASPTQPPGWRKNDSTHYDPTRSWDGWGKFSLSPSPAIDSNQCRNSSGNVWDLQVWRSSCSIATTSLQTARSLARNPKPWTLMERVADRDLRGRAILGRRIFPRAYWSGLEP